MRITLTLEDDAVAKAKAYAQARRLTLGQAVSELIHADSAPAPLLQKKNGVWVFDLPASTPRITSAQVKDLL